MAATFGLSGADFLQPEQAEPNTNAGQFFQDNRNVYPNTGGKGEPVINEPYHGYKDQRFKVPADGTRRITRAGYIYLRRWPTTCQGLNDCWMHQDFYLSGLQIVLLSLHASVAPAPTDKHAVLNRDGNFFVVAGL